jgi:hypothetical protein
MPIALPRIFFDSTRLKKQGPSKILRKRYENNQITNIVFTSSSILARDMANLHLQHNDFDTSFDTGLIGISSTIDSIPKRAYTSKICMKMMRIGWNRKAFGICIGMWHGNAHLSLSIGLCRMWCDGLSAINRPIKHNPKVTFCYNFFSRNCLSWKSCKNIIYVANHGTFYSVFGKYSINFEIS